MKYISVCSGIEAATCAWHSLGWNPVAFSEIEKFPSQVLAHHYPAVPNLGDMTKFKEWPDATIDLLVGGTPCQSFSVAGLRKGLADPRGNLMLTYGAIARRYRPKWLVWENVPGVLSSNGGDDFKSFLDMLESLGYVCDVEILDAQFFGVPQRRRRVFVCAQHRDDLLSQKTDTSALTITQCLQEILLCILSEARSRFGSEQGSSDLPSRSKDGAKRRMELFGLAGEAGCWPMLLENLAEAFRRLPQEQRPLGATHGESGKEPTPGVQSTDSQTESLFTLTEQSLKNALDDALEVMRLFITSTATSSITQAQIFSCSRAALLIAKLTQRLSQSSPAFWNSALSSLTAVEEFTDYARSTSSDLFGDMERLQSWCYFIEQAEHSNDTFISFGVECFGEIFPLPDCLQGHPAPSREAGEGAAGGFARSVALRGREGGGTAELGDDVQNCLRASSGGGDKPHVITMAHGQGGAEIGFDRGPTLTCNHEAPIAAYATCVTGQVTHTLKAEGFDASEDGTGRGQPIVAHCRDVAKTITSNYGKQVDNSDTGLGPNVIAVHGTQDPCVSEHTAFALGRNNGGENAIAFSCKDHGGDAGQISPTMRSMGHDGSHANAGGQVAVAFAMQVRRLTPVECSRLQGFPDDYLETHYADANEANAAQILHTLWREAGTPSVEKQGWRTGISAALLAPEILLAGVYGGWLSWALSARCAAARGAIQGENFDSEGFVRELRRNAELGRSPYQRESFGQLARKLGRSLSELPLESAQARSALRCSGLWQEAQRSWPLRYALATRSQAEKGRMNPDGPRYKALGNSMAVPCMTWIGKRIQIVEQIK